MMTGITCGDPGTKSQAEQGGDARLSLPRQRRRARGGERNRALSARGRSLPMSRRGRTACTGEKRRREAADGAAARALFDLNRIKRAHFRTSSPHIGTRVCLDGWPCRDRSASSAQRAPRFGRRAKQYYLSSPSTLASSASFVAAASASDSRYRSACSGDHTVARMGKHCVKLEPNTSPSFSSSSQNRSAPQKRQGACQARAESGDSQAAPPRPTATTHAHTAPGGVRDATCVACSRYRTRA